MNLPGGMDGTPMNAFTARCGLTLNIHIGWSIKYHNDRLIYLDSIP
jgi:hypothetical protein